MEWYNKTGEELEKELATSLSRGLENGEAAERLHKYGENKLEEAQKKPFLQKLAEQFKDPLVLILIAAAALSAIAGETVEVIIILSIVVLNAIMSIVQEGRAEDSVAALQSMSAPNAKVIRGGEHRSVKSTELVPGDLVLLETGDIVPADLRLTESSNLKIDESSFTGESVAVEKDASEVYDEERGIGDRANYAYSSTIVTYGHGRGLVTDTGTHTEIGKIAATIQNYKEEETPLQKKLGVLSKQLGLLVIGVAVFVLLLGLIAGDPILDIFMTAISLAVAAIPEGMTAVVTIVLSMGMNRMARRNAIVKRLLSVETLGTTTVICSDKTGTLTQNEMTVTKIYVNDQELDVSGSGYAPQGAVSQNGVVVEASTFSELQQLTRIAGLANDAKIAQENGQYVCIGDPTEGALLTLGMKADCSPEALQQSFPRLDEIPFDSDRKMMSTFHEKDDRVVSFTKGAPDLVIAACDRILLDGSVQELTPERREKALAVNTAFASQALRCLAYAYKEYDVLPEKSEQIPKNIERGMVFVGLTGMIDPPRPEAKAAIAECNRAGITTIMITGDYLETAYAIGKELGIASSRDQAIMGSELNGMSEEQVRQVVRHTRIFARVSPENKVQIVNALKANGEIAAMTGDGVNDAPAIKRADIGISMGITGTDVAKNTADVILTDDNFATIVHAVEEGRIIYSNIKKFVSFLLSCNVGEVIVIAAAMVIDLILLFTGQGRFPTPLSPIMLLWLNLVTDSLPALALGVEPGEKDAMDQPPRDPKEPIIDKHMRSSIIVQSIAIGICTLTAFAVGYFFFGQQEIAAAVQAGTYAHLGAAEAAQAYAAIQLAEGQTMAFSTLILAELLRAFAVRSDRYTVWELGLRSNPTMLRAIAIGVLLLLVVLYVPVLRTLFDVSFMTLKEWAVTLPMALLPFAAAEIHKAIKKR
uniref:cation-translocating P-type ATPase n=1 Tax=Ndongobacter massiliensis TaxID=1871025 RepID=UPI0009307CE4|nr:cation-translocating P-type ATPase [Ndongobacter massiliensis]